MQARVDTSAAEGAVWGFQVRAETKPLAALRAADV